MVNNLSIKKIRRLADMEKPKAIAKYLTNFVPSEKRNELEVKLDEYAHQLVNDEKNYTKRDIEKKLEELSKSP
jgi:hypothetical protein